jgi:ubiquinone/menaquinone biosynthesis C-methylase UbiE
MRSSAVFAMNDPPNICDYEGSTYQESFWDQGERDYEDQAEAYALKKLLPAAGNLLLEVGAGAGRNTPRYHGFRKIVLLDYSVTQLQRAQQKLGRDERYLYVAADAYRLPFHGGLFDTATMIRVLHHMADGPRVLSEIRRVTRPGGTFILEFANKRNLKAILRKALGRQSWSPFSPDPIEFVALNFNFHPDTTRTWLEQSGFRPQKWLPVSHFRMSLLKRLFPPGLLVAGDAVIATLGGLVQVSPSVFVRCQAVGEPEFNRPAADLNDPFSLFICPACGCETLDRKPEALDCTGCGRSWRIENGIHIFKEA